MGTVDRRGGRYQKEVIEAQVIEGVLCRDKVAEVNRVKRPPKNADAVHGGSMVQLPEEVKILSGPKVSEGCR